MLVDIRRALCEDVRFSLCINLRVHFLDFYKFICARCTTEVPSKGVVAKIRCEKRMINNKLALFS